MDLRSKSKNKESTKVDPSKGSSANVFSKEKEAAEDEYIYAPVGSTTGGEKPRNRQARTMFVVDLSRLKEERDTLENAIVMYKPEEDFRKSHYEQRCSQVVGLSLCTMNLTGKYPEFLRLKYTGYAIRGLGEHYVMGLSSRAEEPPSYCVNYLKAIHHLFRFYYHSPRIVLKACKEEWEEFTRRMTDYLNSITCYVLRDQYSVTGLFNPLPYLGTNHKKSGSRNYLLASRILRECQNHTAIVGGCLMYNDRLVMSQFPPDFTEKLLLIGGGVISLNKKSVLGDNIAPGKVWVLEVYLLPEEMSEVAAFHKDLSELKNAYASLNRPGNVRVSLVPPTPLNSSESFESGPDPVRSKGHWRRRSSAQKRYNRDSALSSLPSQPPPPPPSQSPLPHTPVTASTPLPRDNGSTEPQGRPKSDSATLSPGLSTVFFDKGSPDARKRQSSSSSGRFDADESEYVDAVETMEEHPSSPKPIPSKLVLESHGSAGEKERPDSVSSEVFATPSPSPPRDTEVGSGGGGGAKEGEDDGTLTRESTGKADPDPASLTDEELAKLINTPVFVNAPNKSSSVSTVTTTKKTHSMAIPPTWRFKTVPESDDEDDFVDSDALQAMLAQKGTHALTHKSKGDNNQGKAPHRARPSSSRSPPPPLPPRNRAITRPVSQPTRVVIEQSVISPPPLPPRNYTLDVPKGTAAQSGGEEPKLSPSNQWLYKTMEKGSSTPAGTSVDDDETVTGRDSPDHLYEDIEYPDGESTNQNGDEESSTTPPVDIFTPEVEGAYTPCGVGTENMVPSAVEIADTSVESEPVTVKEQSTGTEPSQNSEGEAVEESIDIYGDSPNLSISRKVINPPSSDKTSEAQVAMAASGGVKHDYEMDDSFVKSKVSHDHQVDVDRSIDQRSFTAEVESSFECISGVPDGMRTPPQDSVQFNPESLVDGLPMRLRLLRHKLHIKAPAVPPRRSTKRRKSKESNEEEMSETAESSDVESVSSLDDAKGPWMPTLKRPQSNMSTGPYISKMCLYVQQYMSTEIVLVGKENLHKNHSVLNSLWRSLLQQLTDLDNALKKESLLPRDKPPSRQNNAVVTYSSLDNRCEAMPLQSMSYHFRHALRRVHQEYTHDPSLQQASLSFASNKGSLRLLSQSVHSREVYLQPSRLGHLDVLAMHGAVEKYAKVRNSSRQQPSGCPKVMFV